MLTSVCANSSPFLGSAASGSVRTWGLRVGPFLLEVRTQFCVSSMHVHRRVRGYDCSSSTSVDLALCSFCRFTACFVSVRLLPRFWGSL